MARLTPGNAEFAIVSFEGPDEYARAGGLAVRVRDLSATLAAEGFRTHLFFVGDPSLPAVEEQGNLVLHRWSQWISAYHLGGVYEGEWGKLDDMAGSLPPALTRDIVRPAAAAGKVTVLMAEDWHTARTVINAAQHLAGAGLRDRVVPLWTANNLYGFHAVDFGALQYAAAVATVSRYMKHRMVEYGVNPLVTPNGIAPSALVSVSRAERDRLRAAFRSDVALFKIGRFTPDKRWIMAIEAVALLKYAGLWSRILIRGDRSDYGQEVLGRAQSLGLSIGVLSERYATARQLAAAIAERPEDVLVLTSFLPDALVPVIYAAVDGVLANSGFEPFGLVGLEVMGAGGLAFVGSTGEDYAEPQRNAVVLDTDDPREIVVQLRQLQGNAAEIDRLKRNGKKTARDFLWPEVLRELLAKLDYVAYTRGVDIPPNGTEVPE
jgi:glycosyltransferase involved in cell wall biosynthesis